MGQRTRACYRHRSEPAEKVPMFCEPFTSLSGNDPARTLREESRGRRTKEA
jgi:hypothetical protein